MTTEIQPEQREVDHQDLERVTIRFADYVPSAVTRTFTLRIRRR